MRDVDVSALQATCYLVKHPNHESWVVPNQWYDPSLSPIDALSGVAICEVSLSRWRIRVRRHGVNV